MNLAASIIICTCNRANSLAATLEAIGQICSSTELQFEIIVVDNASIDQTYGVVESTTLAGISLKYVYEPRRGLCFARNSGMAEAEGQVLLFTDDDICPVSGWIDNMCQPILVDRADAVAGGIKIAPHLLRPWMTINHRVWLTSTEYSDPVTPDLVGANMAFSRDVLERVPAFDTELDVGQLGLGGDTLFGKQIAAAGYHTLPRLEIIVEHHFDPTRLHRASFAQRARDKGRTLAYLSYHWEHQIVKFPHLRLLKSQLRLVQQRQKYRQSKSEPEGMSLWEMSGIAGVSYYQQYLIEQKRPFNYEKHGLKKIQH